MGGRAGREGGGVPFVSWIGMDYFILKGSEGGAGDVMYRIFTTRGVKVKVYMLVHQCVRW